MGSLTPRHGGGRHKVVCLDNFPCPVPKFAFPHEYVEYQNTMGEDLIIERARDATIIITSRVPVSAYTVAACPRLELVAFMTTGTDIADKKACRARGIAVCNAPGANAESVAEHAFALYLAAKRQVVGLHRVTLEAEAWPMENYVFHLYPQLPRGLRHEVLGIIGYGAIGRNAEAIGKALGMSVLIAERKSVAPDQVRVGRVPFEEVIKTCTVLILGCPLDDESRNMISEPELRNMRPDSIVVNVARGGIMNEAALLKALKEKWIYAAATDVFVNEPATKEGCQLLRECPPNLTLSPHVAWYGGTCLENLQLRIKETIESYVAGKVINSVL
ncbi:uncharacterized protein GGS22DRAFT_42284 [Annulohypoxylon maeteangense]|uniref:uncharacterized protein n=1 Tax=Annulohypoxylon maeteangense TaxID=1927788 RepID=UPI002007E9DD|nr:uncharacterized protein GGS22DRAFT_42284 [Annulohypoxylon maeteangense]KAI0882911.1 hypothetical protein GGS22DRAFT_42284 [Annulohypoxylon maeteangense]